MNQETYVVHLRVMPGDPRPGVTRLRQLLKVAKRAMRLQCAGLRPGEQSAEDPAPLVENGETP